MNKRIEVTDNIKAISILKKIGISIDFGFMLFHPDTTYSSFYENVSFLENICLDGYMPVTYFKMLPYLETKIEKELTAQGKLKGKPGFLDYDFHNESLTDFHYYVFDCFNSWLNHPNGLLNLSKWASNFLSVYSFLNKNDTRIQSLSNTLKSLVSDSNRFMFATLKELAAKFESGDYRIQNDKLLNDYRASIEEKHNTEVESMRKFIEKIELLSLTNVFLRI
jgi:hypothetical protein